jgi:hypothetical protein
VVKCLSLAGSESLGLKRKRPDFSGLSLGLFPEVDHRIASLTIVGVAVWVGKERFHRLPLVFVLALEKSLDPLP